MEISDGPTGVVSEMVKASSGFGTWWMTDLIDYIVGESCVPDSSGRGIMMHV